MLVNADIIIDLRGLDSEALISKARKAMDQLHDGHRVEFLSDSPSSKGAIPKLCQQVGCKVAKSIQQHEVYRFIVRR